MTNQGSDQLKRPITGQHYRLALISSYLEPVAVVDDGDHVASEQTQRTPLPEVTCLFSTVKSTVDYTSPHLVLLYCGPVEGAVPGHLLYAQQQHLPSHTA